MLAVLNLTLFVCGWGRYWICAGWCEVWNQTDAELAPQRTITVICIMLMENAGINIQINIIRLRIPAGGRQTSWLCTSAAEKLKRPGDAILGSFA